MTRMPRSRRAAARWARGFQRRLSREHRSLAQTEQPVLRSPSGRRHAAFPAPNGGFARYRPTAVTTLRDQPPNAWRTSASPVLGPDGGQASNQRVVEHEEPAEIEPPLSKIITS